MEGDELGVHPASKAGWGVVWPFLWEGKRAFPQLCKGPGWNREWERLIIGFGCHKRNLCFCPQRCSFGTSDALSISGTALPTPILTSGQVFPPQSPFSFFFNLYTCFTLSLQARRIAPWDRAPMSCLWGWASGHFGRTMWQHKGAGQLGRASWGHFAFLFVSVWEIPQQLVLLYKCVHGDGSFGSAWLGFVCQYSFSSQRQWKEKGHYVSPFMEPSWGSFLYSSPWLDSWLQALTICRAGNIVLYAVVSCSEFKGREILGVLLCLHLGQTNPLLWVCSKALLLDQIAAEWHFFFF